MNGKEAFSTIYRKVAEAKIKKRSTTELEEIAAGQGSMLEQAAIREILDYKISQDNSRVYISSRIFSYDSTSYPPSDLGKIGFIPSGIYSGYYPVMPERWKWLDKLTRKNKEFAKSYLCELSTEISCLMENSRVEVIHGQRLLNRYKRMQEQLTKIVDPRGFEPLTSSV